MKRLNLSSTMLITGALALFAIIGCKKDDENQPEPTFSPSSTTSQYFDARKVATQNFSIPSNSSQTITTKAGMELKIPANAFVDMGGNPVSGNIDFKVKEIYKKSDMIKSNRPTSSEGKVLISGGEFYFSASLNGDSLQVKDGVNINVESPAATVDSDMILFTGEIDSQGQFNWEELFGPNSDSVRITNNSYLFNLDTLGWINIDKFYNSTTTTLTINLEAGFTTSKALTFIVFNDINSVLSPSTYNGTIEDNAYTQSLIPVGESVSIISISEKGGYLFLAQSDLTISENAVVNLAYNKLSESEIDAVLSTLD